MSHFNTPIFSKEEQTIAEELLQSINIDNNKNSLTYFLTASEQQVFKKIIDFKYPNLSIEFFGGLDNSEKARAKIIANTYYDIDYNIICLKATLNKFHQIKHRDVMGAIYNIGIKENRLGDIIVTDTAIYIFVDKSMADYIQMNFSRIGRAVLTFEIVEDLASINVSKQYEEFFIISSSFRLDLIISKITNQSRSKVKEMFEQNFIKLNHITINSPEKLCKISDTISIRRYGRYIIKSSSQNKKSGKYKIIIDKLV